MFDGFMPYAEAEFRVAEPEIADLPIEPTLQDLRPAKTKGLLAVNLARPSTKDFAVLTSGLMRELDAKAVQVSCDNGRPGGFFMRPVHGKAGVDYHVVQTPPDQMAKLLKDRLGIADPANSFAQFDYYTLLLNMSAWVLDPARWSIRWARYLFDIDGTDVQVINFNPDLQGIKATIEKTGSRSFKATLAAELVPGVEHSQTSTTPTGTQSTKVTSGGKVGPGIEVGDSTGWKVTYDALVEEFRGHALRAEDRGMDITWDLYRNPAVKVPGDKIGETVGVAGVVLLACKKGTTPSVRLSIAGETRSHLVNRRGLIEATGITQFEVKPTHPS